MSRCPLKPALKNGKLYKTIKHLTKTNGNGLFQWQFFKIHIRFKVITLESNTHKHKTLLEGSYFLIDTVTLFYPRDHRMCDIFELDDM